MNTKTFFNVIEHSPLDKNPNFPKFLNKQQTCFRDIHGTCDTVYLHSQGIGAEVHHTPIVTPDEEEKPWPTEVFNINNPKALQYVSL